MNIDFEDRRFYVVLMIVVIFVMGYFFHSDENFECESPSKYCVLRSTNVYGIEHSKKLMIAKLVDGIFIDKYIESRGRKYSRNKVTRYRLNIVSKTKSIKKVFDGFRTEAEAAKKGNEILDCIKKEQYPCKIHW